MKIEKVYCEISSLYILENLLYLSDPEILTRFEVNLWLHINDLYTISRDNINDSET